MNARSFQMAVLWSLAMAAANAEDGHMHHAPSAAGYVPGLGELMTLQQMRHAKLWLAGSQKNWPLADYELDELREGFEDVQKLHATHEGVPVGAMVKSLTAAPVEALGKAIDAKDAAAFGKSFDQLTDACNTCHRAAKRSFIVITRPSTSAFPNQKFAP
jgi:hypothetical protein